MKDYKIRIATKDDVRNLAVLKQKVWSETYRGIYSDDLIDKFDYEKAEATFLNIINNEIKNKNYNRFFISCNKYNTNARKFYEKMGGQLIAEDEDNDNKRIVQVKYHYDIK